VRELGEVMCLSPARGRGKLCSVSGRKQTRGRRGAAGRGLSCWLGPARDRHAEVLRMERITTAIAEQSLARGGLLLHGALAVRAGAGFILAGPSGIGKSTASRRLPAPWKSLSDDCVLVVRDPDGLHWAHPWPTWSLLRDSGPTESWPVEQAVPLKALLFLRHSRCDRTEPVTATPAAALIVESAVQLARTVMFTPEGNANRAICAKYLRAAWALAAAVPAFRLHIGLNGRFWDEIERTVATEPQMDGDGHRCGHQTEQNAELRTEGTSADCADEHRAPDVSQEAEAESQKPKPSKPATQTRRRRSVPDPPRRLLSGSPKPRLIRFQAGHRTFLKLVTGRRVVASVNDIMREWHVRRPSRRTARKQPAGRRP
jgi:SynChlorMet cassette protein ScmC